MFMLTDNETVLAGIGDTLTIFCVQRSAKKKVVAEEDLIESNIAGFGDAIGQTTNRITGMYDVKSGYAPDSREAQELEYRIMSGQL